jgi:hypothetical protein
VAHVVGILVALVAVVALMVWRPGAA